MNLYHVLLEFLTHVEKFVFILRSALTSSNFAKRRGGMRMADRVRKLKNCVTLSCEYVAQKDDQNHESLTD